MKVLNYIKKFKADVVLLSEAHMLDGDYKKLKSDWGLGEIFIYPLNERSAGQVILFQGAPDLILNETPIPERLQILSFNKSQCTVNIVDI